LQIEVVGVYNDLVRRSRKQGSPIFERHYDGQEFEIVNVVIALCFIERCRVVSYGVLFTVLFSLKKYRAYRISGGIYF